MAGVLDFLVGQDFDRLIAELEAQAADPKQQEGLSPEAKLRLKLIAKHPELLQVLRLTAVGNRAARQTPMP